MSETRWFSVDEIAEHLGVGRETIYDCIEKREMPAHKVGRFWKFQKEDNEYILKKDMTSLFPQTDYFQFEFPPPQYLGAKYLMREWIGEHIPMQSRSVLDVFAGSQSMSFYFKQRGLKVFSNDFMAFSHQIGLSLIENKAECLNRDDINILFSKNPDPQYYNLMTTLFANLFFSEEETIMLDAFRGNVEKLNNCKRALALTIMNRALCRKVTMGHFAHTRALIYANDVDRIKRNASLICPIKDIFMEYLPLYNSAVFDNGQENKSFNSDAIAFIAEHPNFDVAYFDPPYCDSHADYQRYYHLLETFTMYWRDKKFVNSINRYEPKRSSGFELKRTIMESLQKLCENAEEIPLWIFSYNDRSNPSIENFVNLLEQFRKVEIKRRMYVNSRGGRGSVAGSHEVLLIAKEK